MWGKCAVTRGGKWERVNCLFVRLLLVPILALELRGPVVCSFGLLHPKPRDTVNGLAERPWLGRVEHEGRGAILRVQFGKTAVMHGEECGVTNAV